MTSRSSSSLSIVTINTLNPRESVQQIRRLSEESVNGSNVINHEQAWRLSYLKGQYNNLDLNELFDRYTQRINYGYFSLLLLLLVLLSGIHFLAVLLSNMESTAVDKVVIPDLSIYATMFLLSLIGAITDLYVHKDYERLATNITDSYVEKERKRLAIASCICLTVMFFSNFFIPIYHFFGEPKEYLQPAYTSSLVTSCYVFFNITHNRIALISGMMVTITHVITVSLFTYKGSSMIIRRVVSDIIYLICLNGLGLYFRFINEIVQRKGFLDRRRCVESNLNLRSEKQQEELLMLSIIPKHIVEEVRRDILDTIKLIELTDKLPRQKPFENPYINSHSNVTILYADIVNYTEMTTKLKPPTKLVETLNDLFGRFDDASQDLKVLRIKFLGDCYYCVAGLPPDCIENHADACVELGLRMVKIIRQVREQRNLTIDMRIGIHTGNILSGLIGLMKWQFDIWSTDADIANRMETRGVPGKVHITKQTKDLLKNSYNIVPSLEGTTDPVLKQYNIDTYLVSPPVSEAQPQNGFNARMNSNRSSLTDLSEYKVVAESSSESWPSQVINERRDTIYQRRPSGNPALALANIEKRVSANPSIMMHRNQRRSGSHASTERVRERRITPGDGQRRTAFMDNNIHRYQERLSYTDDEMKKAIATMPLTKHEQWFKVKEINPVLLIFRTLKTEMRFFKNYDPLFKFYLIAAMVVLISITLIQNLTLERWDVSMWLNYVSIAVILFILVPIAWMQYIWDKYIVRLMPRVQVPLFLKKCSEKLFSKVMFRIVMYCVVCAIFVACVFTEVLDCRDKLGRRVDSEIFLHYAIKYDPHEAIEYDTYHCIIPWHMSETCALAIFTSFSFIRVHLWIKAMFSFAITVFYGFALWSFSDGFYESGETINRNVAPKVAHTVVVVFVAITLHLIDRQTDYMTRLDYQWNERLIEEKREANTMHKINNILLNNILPTHVVDLYLDVNRQTQELYYESYNNVAVMFASIVDYTSDVLDDKKLLMKIMNQVIGDFDKLLLNRNWQTPIEKIKVAKWTYMAACGLDPGRCTDKNTNQKTEVVVTLLQFAANMMDALSRINREFMQEMKLRIGIAHGELTAGVIGIKKPLYDIWGDPVNMASRMDSTGVPGKIQVPEMTADVIRRNGIVCEYRDKINVKGIPEPVPTYFVTLSSDNKLVIEDVEEEYVTPFS